MLTTGCIAGTSAVFKPSASEARQNAPTFTTVYLRRILRVLVLVVCAAALACTGGSASARSDLAPGTARADTSDAWLRFNYSRFPYDLPTAGNQEHRRGASSPPTAQPGNDQRRPGNDQRADSPPYCKASCIIELRGEPEHAGDMPAAITPSLTPPAHPLPVAVANALAASSSVQAPSSTAYGHWLSAKQAWLVADAVVLVGAVILRGAAVLWFFGLAGFIVGGASLMIDLTWQIHVITFAILGIGLVMLWAWLDGSRTASDDGDASPLVGGRHPRALVGRVFRLERPIEGGAGMVTFGGTAWRVAGRDCAAGKQVKVLRTEGTLLVVEPLEC
jgi:inner membrane protein